MLTHRSNLHSVNPSKYCSPGGGLLFLFLFEPKTRKGSTLHILFRGMWVQLHTRSSAHNGPFLTDGPASFWTVTVPDSSPPPTSTSPSFQHVTGHAWERRTPPPLTVTEIRWHNNSSRQRHNKTKTKEKKVMFYNHRRWLMSNNTLNKWPASKQSQLCDL